jgi:hypothetical protein
MMIRPPLIGVVCALALTCVTNAWANPRESQVKAVYLNGYSKFINWPNNAFAAETSPFMICVFGDNPFGNALQLAVANETVKGRPVQALDIISLDDIPQCHILYISESERIRFPSILEKAQHYPVLTVSDVDNFVVKGGMVQFYSRDKRVRFLIDPASVRQVGLEPNAHLLRISDIVESAR